MERKQILEAAKLLNESGFSTIKIKTTAIKDEDLKLLFMNAFETTKEADEEKMDKLIIEVYCFLRDEYDKTKGTATEGETTGETEQTTKTEGGGEEMKNGKKKEEVKPSKAPAKKEKAVAKTGKEKEKKEKKEKKESRPDMLKRKVNELGKNVSIEALLKDKELLDRFNQKVNFIKNDFRRLQKQTKKAS